jgi:hypothetical protein
MVIPVLVMASFVPSLERSAPKQDNYRGRPVFVGLGAVWFVWLISFWIGAHILALLHIAQPAWVTYLLPLFPLIAGTCVFGLVDDWLGSRETLGFSGHLRALARGRITTGGLKFLGIGLLSLFTAVSLYYAGADTIPRVLLVTCVLALSANLLNLFDLRPLRASKAYLLLLIAAAVCVLVTGVVNIGAWDTAALLLAALGPIIAVWRFDAQERGMIGDVGANSMGILIGYLFATALPFWGLVVCAAILLVLNLASERFSFTQVIEHNKVLKAGDMLGRNKG